MKNKIIIFKSRTEHFWYSCRIIEEHILNAFKQSSLNYEIYEWNDSLTNDQLDKLKKSEDKLHFYFLSDFMKQQDICLQLKTATINGTYYIPIYGNMTVEIYRWLSLGKLLKDQKVFLLGASRRSCLQIQSFVDAEIVEVPFCFETHVKRKSSSDKINLVYAGRITPQKNIIEMIQAFREAYDYNSNLHLHIAGQFHDRKFHLHGYSLDLKKYNDEVLSLFYHPGITYHQNLDQNQLLNLYSESDYFISMSTYHDEDFGMSACQASVIGLGLILSDWGGQAAFKENAQFIPVTVNELSLPVINQTKLMKTLAGLKHPPVSNSYKDRFSYSSFIQNLSRLVSSDPGTFKGLRSLYEEYAQIGLKTFPFSNLEKSPTKKDFYLKVYQSYLSDR